MASPADSTVTGDDVEPQRPIPRFLTEFTPTRWRRRLSPFSRVPKHSKMGETWHVAAKTAPDELVIVDRPPDIDPDGAEARTYTQWAELVDRAAAWLHKAGVRPWDRVAILKQNHLDIVILGCAIARIGAIPCMFSGSYGPEAMIPMLERLERPFLLTDQKHLDKCGITPEVVAELTVRTISVDAVADRADVLHLEDFKDAPPVQPNMREFKEPVVITHTSGTTGVPKLVMHSAESIYAMAIVETERWPRFGLRRSDTVAFCDPYTHERLTTMQLAMAAVGPRVLFLSDPLSPRIRELLAEHKPTLVEALPNIYLAWEPLARDPAGLFSNVREYVNSFDAIHTRTIRTFMAATKRRFPIWVQSWSQSENGALCIRPFFRFVVRRKAHRPPPTQLIGWPIPFHAKMRAVDPETGKEVPRGQVGLIEIDQPGRCLAYVGEQDRHDLKCNGRWWNTGDLAIINKWGAVRIVDREIDRIPGGSAIEFEDLILDRIDYTTEVVILPVAGDLPVPVVSTADDVPLDKADWERAVADLSPMAPPIQIKWDEFPRTGTWKIRRAVLREKLLSDAQAIGTGRWT
ncbi:Acyl-CoA synthetase (AMP-forming)/AMP-acid ligase II [Micromonospora viridifaciens]|uniref:Acyl-CoA synthetase (AMP-forming)/AMP-acid ligase II n=2 Tax=Micromonospora viridifaciens TaxID=1881 RepID=A0A1C4WYW7_MICVI|nr:Acyl-CoA synthetase (AMP-forming)/AMP-acid ligase II [Micromonospora viridifaciens]